jgi:Predicted metal-dependent hydrolase
LNKTTIFAIMLHELAHLKYMNHGPKFAFFLKEIYEYADQ